MMGSRREEERNEKVIRGLLKLPPNRKCINCNSLGPQYVCTNFWTFVCITCSGIHREFTHRVKSVSMAKFTSQEVEALQRGGNQRAREIYLRDWDMQHQRLPSSSNIERVREFIKSVYVDRKYTSGKSSDKPPRDMHGYKNHEDERRASSYHSYSQSPPYDYQYEERRYGKQAGMLARKPGGSFSGIAYSPGRAAEDRFANEGPAPRLSDYSVSSAGGGSNHGVQSPAFGRDSGYSSPLGVPVRNILIEDGRRQTLNTFLETDSTGNSGVLGRPPHSRRPASSESFGSFDSSSTSLRSVKSGGLVDVIEREQTTGMQPPATFPSTVQASVAAVGANGDFFGLSVSNDQPPPKPTQSLDLFADVNNPVPSASLSGQNTMAAPSQSVDIFADINNPVSSAALSSSLNLNVAEAPSQSVTLFVENNNPLSSASLSVQSNVTDPSIVNEGWATFDMPQNSTSKSAVQTAPLSLQSTSDPKASFDAFSLASNNMQQSSTQQPSDLWTMSSKQMNSAPLPSGFQPWNAFGVAPDETTHATFGDSLLEGKPQIPAGIPTNPVDSGLKDHDKDNLPGFSGSFVSWHVDDNATTTPVLLSAYPGELAQKPMSKNPFDFPSESDPELTNTSMPLDMSSLQAMLPNPQFSNSPSKNVDWFPQFPLPSGGLSYMAPPNSQMPNLPQSSVASLGGNPFA